MNKKCQVCEESYWIRKSHAKNSYCCSSKCMYIRRGRIYRGKKSKAWKGGRFIAKNGYVMVYLPDHPRSYSNGYALEHVVIAEREIGRAILPTECVHHINHIKTDNRPANLEVITTRRHKSIHMKERHKEGSVVISKRDKSGRIAKGGTSWDYH